MKNIKPKCSDRFVEFATKSIDRSLAISAASAAFYTILLVGVRDWPTTISFFFTTWGVLSAVLFTSASSRDAKQIRIDLQALSGQVSRPTCAPSAEEMRLHEGMKLYRQYIHAFECATNLDRENIVSISKVADCKHRMIIQTKPGNRYNVFIKNRLIGNRRTIVTPLPKTSPEHR